MQSLITHTLIIEELVLRLTDYSGMVIIPPPRERHIIGKTRGGNNQPHFGLFQVRTPFLPNSAQNTPKMLGVTKDFDSADREGIR